MSSTSPAVGIVVGVGVGCTILGAVIAALLSRWFAKQQSEPVPYTADIVHEIVTSGKLKSMIPHGYNAGTSSNNTFRLLIDTFVESFHERTDPLEDIDIDNARLAAMSSHECDWSSLIKDPTTRGAAIKMFMARYIALRLDPTGDPSTTLLAPGLIETWQHVIGGWNKAFPRGYHGGGFANNLSWNLPHVWRAIGARVLLEWTYASRNFQLWADELPATDLRHGRVSEAAEGLLQVLSPFKTRERELSWDPLTSLTCELGEMAMIGMLWLGEVEPVGLRWADAKEIPPGHIQVYPGFFHLHPFDNTYVDHFWATSPYVFPRDEEKGPLFPRPVHA